MANLADLPNGVFVKFAEEPYLVYYDWLLAWSAGGYTKRMDRPHNAEVIVLTPNPLWRRFVLATSQKSTPQRTDGGMGHEPNDYWRYSRNRRVRPPRRALIFETRPPMNKTMQPFFLSHSRSGQ